MNRRAGDRRKSVMPDYSASTGHNRLQIPPDVSEREKRFESIRTRYVILLRRYLDERQEEVLLDVYRLGREAVVEELGLLSISELHHEALCRVVRESQNMDDDEEWHEMAGIVLSEFLSAYEMTSRGYREASTAMRHLNEMLEDEVRRIAHAIHDGAGQYLACVHISLYGIAKHVDEKGKAELKRAHELLDELERDLRRVSHELRPRVLENAGLSGAVDFLVDGVSKRTGLNIHVANELESRPPVVIETALYRCVQELLNNAAKHSEADNVWVILRNEAGQLYCEVRDDGVGFDTSDAVVRGSGHQLGFLGIQERVAVLGGTLEVESSRGNGVRVLIKVPV